MLSYSHTCVVQTGSYHKVKMTVKCAFLEYNPDKNDLFILFSLKLYELLLPFDPRKAPACAFPPNNSSAKVNIAIHREFQPTIPVCMWAQEKAMKIQNMFFWRLSAKWPKLFMMPCLNESFKFIDLSYLRRFKSVTTSKVIKNDGCDAQLEPGMHSS